MKRKLIMLLSLVVILSLVLSIVFGCTASAEETEEVTEETTEEETTEEETVMEETQEEETAEIVEEEPGEVDALEEDVKIGYVCKVLDNPWFRPVTDTMAEVIEDYGGELIAVDAQMDPELYTTSIDNLISQGVEGMVVTPPDQTLSRVTVDKCEAVGIPVLAYADPLIDEDGNLLAPAGVLDGYQSGYLMGEWLANYAKENDLIQDPSVTGYATITCLSVSNFVPRTEGSLAGWKDNMPDYPESQYFTNDTDTSLTEEAYDSMNALITANPDIQTWFVTGPNDETIVGVARALEVAGLDDTSYIAGLGAYLCKDEWKKESSCIVVSLYIDAKAHGKKTGEDIMEWVVNGNEAYADMKEEGSEYGLYGYTGEIVTPDNYQEIMGADAE